MSDGMSQYWKEKRMRELEILIEKSRDSVARVIGRPDLDRSRKRRPIIMMSGQLVDLKDVKMSLHKSIPAIDVIGKFEVDEITMEATAVRFTKKDPDKE